MEVKWQHHFMISCTRSKTDFKEDLLQEHSEVCPRTIFKYNPEIHDTFICKNPDAYLAVHPHELRWRSWSTQQHSEVSQFAQNFTLKLVGPRTRGIRPVVTLQRLQRLKNSINRDQDLSIQHTFAKHTRKQHKSVWSFSKNIDHHKDSKKSSKV